jgi:hypothetical protein
MMTGIIYGINQRGTDRWYVGKTSREVDLRWQAHRLALRNGQHHSVKLQRAWAKYGESAFAFVVLAHDVEPAALGFVESKYAYHFAAYFNGTIPDPHQGAFRLTEYTKKLLSDLKKGHKDSDVTRRKKSRSHTLRWAAATPEMKVAHASHQLGRKRDPSVGAKISAARKRYFSSPEGQAEIATRTGVARSPETKKKMSASRSGIPMPAEAVKRLWRTRKRHEREAMEANGQSFLFAPGDS